MSIGDLVATLRMNNAPLAAGLRSARGLFGSFAGGFSAMLRPVTGSFSGMFDVSHALAAAGAQAAAQKRLAAVVAATGGAAGLSTQQMVEFAGSLSRTTNFSETTTTAAMALLSTFRNVKGDTFKEAVKSAQDLSAVTGNDLNSSIRAVGRALNDPLKGMMALKKAGVALTQDQQSQIRGLAAQGDLAGAQKAILDAISGTVGGAAQNMASPLTQLRNMIEELSAAFGTVLGPTVKAVAAAFGEALGPLEGARGSLQQFGALCGQVVTTFLVPLGTAVGQTFQLLLGMFAGGSVAAADFGNVAKLALDSLTLGMIKLLPNGEQIFTDLGITINAVWEGVSAAADALWNNLKSGFTTVSNFITTRARALWEAVKAGLHGQNPLDAYNRGLDEALKHVTEPAAYKGPIDAFWNSFEKAAADASEGIQDSGGLQKVLAVDKNKLAADVKSTLDALPKLPGIKTPEFKMHAPGATGAAASIGKQAHEKSELGALTLSSKEVLSQIAGLQRGEGADAAKRTADAAEKAADLLAQANEKLEEIADGDDEVTYSLAGG